ncbi:TetR family transcriptional regulator [Rhodococcus ruber Chol-4]|uniref:TetR/AcrR family transcriptional regulator n=1 Tax=Rhodococcus ruber TaxID=1830 RepID=UPI0003487BA0|nr:TetR/AcrR family transcriptional regulator [Rhodococcus ruber]MDO2380494.1 helix-turn-helix domain-containing protein [Rhodococcus ruber]RIK10398.1 MAG: TetR/AcrR family transcriptional regulator [Acidobacteriota bacterium]AWG99756.1 TetR/AcrR family transcriptional regulator [Rhodococcus ruber]KXF86996.1 TetR family transcriptional regulator [Rhodococcus ruber Chol-4]MDO1479886.1 TetR/AcrR family transcriptional regulator [Rhodococcus ruber]
MVDIPLLPLAGDESVERCDAARNRRRLLEAASLLVAERGVDAVTMDAVAARAGVGKGTVFRRFGSRAGLMRALLDHSEQALQQQFLTGPPPLGPGADPVDRLVAFGRARIRLVEVQGEVLRAAESSAEARFNAPARAVSLTHIEFLLRTAGVDGDLPLLAQSLFAPLEATLVLHQWRDLGYSLDRLADGWADLARRVVTAPAAAGRTVR